MFKEFIRNFFAGLLFVLACYLPMGIITGLPFLFVDREKINAVMIILSIIASAIVSVVATIIYNYRIYGNADYESSCYNIDYFESKAMDGEPVSVHCANAVLIPNILLVIACTIIYSVAMIKFSANRNVFNEDKILFDCALLSGWLLPNQFCYIVLKLVGYASCACGKCHKMCTWVSYNSVKRDFKIVTHESNDYKTGEISFGDGFSIPVYERVYRDVEHDASYKVRKCRCRNCGRTTTRVGGLYTIGFIDKIEREHR